MSRGSSICIVRHQRPGAIPSPIKTPADSPGAAIWHVERSIDRNEQGMVRVCCGPDEPLQRLNAFPQATHLLLALRRLT